MASTVTVACKIPNGLILRVFNQEEYDEPVLGGGVRKAKRAVQVGNPVKIDGPAVPFGMQPNSPISGGYALTAGVDADIWTKWLEQNADLDAVKNKLVFAHARQDSAAAEARENETRVSGLQPIDPNGDARVGRNRLKIETATKN